MNISDYLRNNLLNHSLGVANFPMPSGVYAALYTTPPTSAGGGVEVTGPDYQRVITSWSTAAIGEIENAVDIRFPAAGQTLSNWGIVVAAGLFDAPINGNLLFFGLLSANVTLALGTDFSITTNDLLISLS